MEKVVELEACKLRVCSVFLSLRAKPWAPAFAGVTMRGRVTMGAIYVNGYEASRTGSLIPDQVRDDDSRIKSGMTAWAS